MSFFKKLKALYRSSQENRTQIILFLGFVIIPVIGMTALYLWVSYFWLK